MNYADTAAEIIENAANIAENGAIEQTVNQGVPLKAYIFLGLVIIVFGAFIYFLIKFRKRFAIINEFLTFLWKEKMWWMIPLILILLGMGLLIFFSSSSGALAPFIYPLF